MTATIQTSHTKRVPMNSLRKTALFAGVLYVITFISIPTLFLYGPVRAIRTTSSAPARTPPSSSAASSR